MRKKINASISRITETETPEKWGERMTELLDKERKIAREAGRDEAVEKISQLPFGTNGQGEQWVMKKDVDDIIKTLQDNGTKKDATGLYLQDKK